VKSTDGLVMLQTCQVAACPLTTPVTANLPQLTGTGKLDSASPVICERRNIPEA